MALDSPDFGLSPELCESFVAQLRTSLGSKRAITRAQPCNGGDICQSFSVQLDDGHQLFLKYLLSPPAHFFEREADGLRWLSEKDSVRTPHVIASFDGHDFGFLILEWIPQASPNPDFDRKLGQALARLHQESADHFGWQANNYLGPIAQNNATCPIWSEFYTKRRLLPLIEELENSFLLPSPIVRQLEAIIVRLPELVGPPEPPAKLHGDLWNGNILCDRQQNVWLIDPAVYLGNREIDLAMLRLFGGFSQELFESYDKVYPRQAGHEYRLALYQLYPLLVHVKLFGPSYHRQLASTLNKLLI